MTKEPIGSLNEHFADLTDPRGPNIEHLLFDIVALAILGTICGAAGWVEIEQFGRQKIAWLSQYLHLPNGIPSHDTFGRVFSQISPEEFQNCFIFKYSPRPGTRASKLKDDVLPEIKHERHQRLLQLQKDISTRRHESLHAKQMEILVEGVSKRNPQRQTGRARTGEIVTFESEKNLTGRFIKVKILSSTALTLFGKVI